MIALNELTNEETEKLLLAAATESRGDAQTYCEFMMSHEGNEVLPHDIHYLIHEALRVCKDAGKHCVIVMPPESGKTSMVAKWIAWHLGHNPRLRIGLVSGDDDLSKRNLIKLRKTLLNRLNQAIFPNLLPDLKRSKSGGTWNMTTLYFEDMVDPCVEVFALEGASEGARLDIIWLDDAVTRRCQRSEMERERAHNAVFGTWLQRKTANGFCIFTNNVWHREDPIHKMLDSGSFMVLWMGYEETDRIYWRIHHPAPGWKHKLQGELPLWDWWPKERLESKREEDRATYKRLYEGRAIVTEDCRFPPMEAWARYDALPSAGSTHRIVGFLDPSGGKKAAHEDFAALWALLVTPEDVFVLDCWIDRALPNEQINMLWEMHERIIRQGYRGFDVLELEVLPKDQGWVMQPFLQEGQRRRREGVPNWNLNLMPKAPWENKMSRIERLASPLRNGWLRWPKDLDKLIRDGSLYGKSLMRLIQQMEDFPFGDHDDGPDALSGAYDLAVKQRPYIPGAKEAKKQAMDWLARETRERARTRVNVLDIREPKDKKLAIGAGWNL